VKFCAFGTDRYPNADHHSEYIHDNIRDSLQRAFSLQGIGLDPEELEDKVELLVNTNVQAQAELDSYGILSMLRIIPWGDITREIIPFLAAVFVPPAVPPAAALLYLRKRNTKYAERYLSTVFSSLLGGTFGFFILGLTFLYFSLWWDARNDLCSAKVDCQFLVHSGSYYSNWYFLASECVSECPQLDTYELSYSTSCADCICNIIHDKSEQVCGPKYDPGWSAGAAVAFGMGMLYVLLLVSGVSKASHKKPTSEKAEAQGKQVAT